jgi:hypothetical protein
MVDFSLKDATRNCHLERVACMADCVDAIYQQGTLQFERALRSLAKDSLSIDMYHHIDQYIYASRGVSFFGVIELSTCSRHRV